MEKDSSEVTHMVRPWGAWYVIEKGKGYKVKRLEIIPNESISKIGRAHV